MPVGPAGELIEEPVPGPVEESIPKPTHVKLHSSECVDYDTSRIQVSAKHLILASCVFKKLLTGGWKESVTYLQKGSVEITAESWT